MQALCFLAGANSIFYGDKLLTTGNPEVDADRALFDKLGMHPMTRVRRAVRRKRAVARRSLTARLRQRFLRRMPAISRRLAALERAACAHAPHRSTAPQSARVVVDGRELVAFASNDYLGLAAHPRLVAAARDGARTLGRGRGRVASRSAATTQPHAALEDAARGIRRAVRRRARADVLDRLSRQPRDPDGARRPRRRVFADRLNHACLNDGALLSRAELRRYAHGDVDALSALLAASRGAPQARS